MVGMLEKWQTGRRAGVALTTAFVVGAGAVSAADLKLATEPLFTTIPVSPNVVLTFDDSASMAWSYLPDGIVADFNDARGLAPNWNYLAYNPDVTYAEPVDEDGEPFSATENFTAPSFSKAYDDGFQAYAAARGWGDEWSKPGCPVELDSDEENGYVPTWHSSATSGEDNCDDYNAWNNNSIPEYWGTTFGSSPDPQPKPSGTGAFYYLLYTDYNALSDPDVTPADCDAKVVGGITTSDPDPKDNDCYVKVTPMASGGPADAKPVKGGRTEAEELQNFANWYSYYRKRTMAAKTAATLALAQLGKGARIGFTRLNTPLAGQTADPKTLGGISEFDITQRALIHRWLVTSPAAGGTPLLRAVNDVGDYYQQSASSLWGGTTCRRAFHVLTTDGYWTDDNSPLGDTDVDGDYGNPFKDDVGGTLADLAMHYWETDLLSGSGNDNVPTSITDPADWQHVVTYALALGVEGLKTSPDKAFMAILYPDSPDYQITWPDPSSSSQARVDDLLHATVNSRGGFVNAQNPKEFAEALQGILSATASASGSASSVVLNSAVLQTNSRVYQAKFYTETWHGSLIAYPVLPNGAVDVLNGIDFADKIPSQGSRSLWTLDDADGRGGVALAWDSLSSSQQQKVDPTAADTNATSSALLSYLRGDRTGEQPSGTFRKRVSLLGDIVNSAPAYVGPPRAAYPSDWGDGGAESLATQKYADFRAANVGRTPMIYVGANDGFLHAFDAGTGAERFAYMPNVLLDKVSALADPGYGDLHQYFVDGSPTVGDVFFNDVTSAYSNSWHTVLVAGLGGGGQGVLSLDITNPAGIEVLWEFTDTDADCSVSAAGDKGDCDLGYTYSRPNIVRLYNGEWAAVFGNGYNSTFDDGVSSSTGNAVLFIVDVETGELIRKIDTGVGALQDPTGATRPNGLASVAPVDIDGDFIVDYVYGGDLFGNVWKFDLTATNPTSWALDYKLFSAATDSANPTTAQPVTTRVQVARHPTSLGGYLVLFGTGKYLETPDVDITPAQETQTFYGIWDKGSAPTKAITRADLLEQEIFAEPEINNIQYRFSTDRPIIWRQKDNETTNKLGWYLDLVNTSLGDNRGERQVSDAILRNDRVIFTTLVPAEGECAFGGYSWLMELNITNGGQPPYPVFDLNADKAFGALDLHPVTVPSPDGQTTTEASVPPSGRKSTVGIVPTPAILSREGGGREYKYQSGSTGEIEVVSENPGPGDFGRSSWLQLFR